MTTIGLEIELPHVATSVQHFLQRTTKCRYEMHDDGSIRNRNLLIDNVPIVPMQVNGRAIVPSGALMTESFGLELVTSPYEAEQMMAYAYELAEAFCKVPDTSRASIHAHTGQVGKSWRKVQRMCRWFYHLEAPLYRLSGLNRKHRGTQPHQGNEQDYNYCRPLSASIGMNLGGRSSNRVPMINVHALLEADTASDFLAEWGRLDVYWTNLQHWCPHRLHGINIVPMMRQGTVEYRIFNGVYRYIPDVVAIVNGLDRLAEQGDPDFEPMILGSEPIFTAEDMGRLLDWDVRHIWGWSWPRGCHTTALQSHYRDGNSAPSFAQQERLWVVNNRGQMDPASGVGYGSVDDTVIDAFSLYL